MSWLGFGMEITLITKPLQGMILRLIHNFHMTKCEVSFGRYVPHPKVNCWCGSYCLIEPPLGTKSRKRRDRDGALYVEQVRNQIYIYLSNAQTQNKCGGFFRLSWPLEHIYNFGESYSMVVLQGIKNIQVRSFFSFVAIVDSKKWCALWRQKCT